MNTEQKPNSLFETMKDIAPGLAGGPVSIWQAARKGTEAAASALPDSTALNKVKGFVQQHPIVSTCIVLAAAYYLTGSTLPMAARVFQKVV